MRVPVKAGLHQVMATMLKTDDAEPEGAGPDRLPLFSRASDNANVVDCHCSVADRRSV